MRSSKVLGIALYSSLFLFFFQLISDFIEATYTFGLLGISLPVEAVSVLLLLSPVVLILMPRGLSGWPFVLLGELMLVCRVVEPMLDTRGRMMVAGLGVACFMILLPVLLSQRAGERRSTMGLTLGIGLTVGLSLSILLRVLGSGSDISTYGWFQPIGWSLAVIAGILVFGLWRPRATRASESPPDDGAALDPGARHDQPGLWRVAGLSLGVISALSLLYFSFTSPNVIARWTGANYLLIVSMIVLALSLFAIVLAAASRLLAALTPRVVLAWNILFVLSVVLTILAHQIRFPADLGAYPVSEPSVTLLHHVPLILMLVLFPVILVDFMLLAQELADGRPSPRRTGAAFTLASLFFLFLIFAHIFTAVYGFVPVVGPPFRDKFWLVYLTAGIALTLPVLLVPRRSYRLDQASRRLKIGPLLPGSIVFISLVTVIGALLTAARPTAPPGDQTTLRILTYNIQQGVGDDGVWNYDGQLDLIRQVDADIIGLQECDTNRIAGGNADVVRYFADRLDLYSYYGPKTVVGTFGVALLSKYPIQNPRTFYMYGVREQKATIEAQMSVGHRTFHVFVTHLGSHEPEPPGNMPQQEVILREVEGKENVILMGDLNFTPDTDQYRLTTETLDDAWLLKWPQGADDQGVDPVERIDYIFVSPGTQVTDSRYLPKGESDHPALTTVIEW